MTCDELRREIQFYYCLGGTNDAHLRWAADQVTVTTGGNPRFWYVRVRGKRDHCRYTSRSQAEYHRVNAAMRLYGFRE